MVIIHIKQTEQNQFLYETQLDTEIEEVLEDLVYIYNVRIKLDCSATALEELIKFGPLRPEEARGLGPDAPLLEPEKIEALTPKPKAHHRYV